MTETDVVNYLTEINKELDNTYQLYQDLLYAIKNKDFKRFVIYFSSYL